MELAEYLSAKFIQRSEHRATSVLVAWGKNCQATHWDVLKEEADTKMMLYPVDIASNGATQINFYLTLYLHVLYFYFSFHRTFESKKSVLIPNISEKRFYWSCMFSSVIDG